MPKQIEDVLHSETSAANDGFTNHHLWIKRNSVEKLRIGH